MSRVDLQPAFILHQRQYRNTSLILDVLTLHHGRIGVVARSARGGKKNTSSILQPFRQLLLSWSGRGDLFTLTNTEDVVAENGNVALVGEALYCGYYLNELTLKLLPRDDAHEEIFVAYNQAIDKLRDSDDMEPTLRSYELTLLNALGYQVVLDFEVVSGDAVSAQCDYKYVPERGPVYMSALEHGVVVSGATLQDLSKRDFSAKSTRDQARKLLRALIDYQLDGRPLKSRELFRSLFRLRANNGDEQS